MKRQHWIQLSMLAAAAACGYSTTAQAGTIDPCNGQCSWTIQSNGAQVGDGQFTVDPDTGAIDLGPVTYRLGGGNWVGINDLSGSSDPVLGFSISAGAGASGRSFSVTFSLPISLSGSIDALSSVSYSLSSLSGSGAQVTPLNGHLVTAQEIDTAPGGLSPLNNGVDIGDTFALTGGPSTKNSPIYSATNTFTGSTAYDLMSVTLSFSLSARSDVGISGFVQQLPTITNPTGTPPLPLPGAGWLLGSALLCCWPLVRRRGVSVRVVPV